MALVVQLWAVTPQGDIPEPGSPSWPHQQPSPDPQSDGAAVTGLFPVPHPSAPSGHTSAAPLPPEAQKDKCPTASSLPVAPGAWAPLHSTLRAAGDTSQLGPSTAPGTDTDVRTASRGFYSSRIGAQEGARSSAQDDRPRGKLHFRGITGATGTHGSEGSFLLHRHTRYLCFAERFPAFLPCSVPAAPHSPCALSHPWQPPSPAPSRPRSLRSLPAPPLMSITPILMC